jgi:predicted permease
MKLSEAWYLSKMPYKEVAYRSIIQTRSSMWWGAFGRNAADGSERADKEMTERTLSIARMDKILVGVVSVIASIAPFASAFPRFTAHQLIAPVSLSLTITFAFVMLYAVQTLSSFVGSESTALLSTLPLTKDDFSLITLFSFIRSVDYMVAGSMAGQVVLVACLTASPLATLLTFVASAINVVFAVSIALWFSKVFYRNLLGGRRSKGSTALRLVFLLAWGLLIMSVGLLLSTAWYLTPSLGVPLLNLDWAPNAFYCVIFPFSVGIAVVGLAYPSMGFSASMAFVVMACYVALAGIAGRWCLGTIRRISQGIGIAREPAKDYSVKVRNPLLGYIIKDLRISSRSPATAFFFALPVFETVIASLLMMGHEVLRTYTIVIGTTMGGIVSLFMPLGLLNAEGIGFEYTKALPMKLDRIVISKALISTATYVPVPLALLSIAFIKSMSAPSAILIPYFTILAIASASIMEIRLFLGFIAKRKIDTLLHDLGRLMAGITIVMIPEVAYVAMYLIWADHVFAISVMGGVATAELAIVMYLLKRY